MKLLFKILLLSATIARGQSSITVDFLLDSLGCNGLRQKHVKQVPFDDLNKRPEGTISSVQVLFDGKSILRESEESIISLLGSPNWAHYSKKRRDKKSRTSGTWRMTNDTLTIIAPKGKKKQDEMHYCINTCGYKRRGIVLVIWFTDNKVTDTELAYNQFEQQ